MSRIFFLIIFAMMTSCSALPTDDFSNWPDLDESVRARYATFLSAAGQEGLPNETRKTIIRVTWLRSFHNPVIVRISCGTRCKLKSLRLSGSGYEAGDIVESHATRLDSAKKSLLLDLIAKARIAINAPSKPAAAKTMIIDGQLVEEIVVHADGSNWLVEILDPAGLEVLNVRGWQLKNMESLSDLLRFMVNTSGIEIPDGEYY